MKTRDSLIATLAYADVFGYPLTWDEVEKWLIKSQKSKVKSQKLNEIKSADGYYFLKDRKKTIALRKQRKRWVKEKMRVAERAALLLKLIPTIKLVGITGALAMENAHRDDDIDFYIVAAAGTLWTTRLFATIILGLFGLRRKPGDTAFRNKICLNMYVDEDHLAVKGKERDLFTAHEVLQMKPLWERDHTYGRFLNVNAWVRKFLPNTWKESQNSNLKAQNKSAKRKTSKILLPVEHILRLIQLWYMRRRRSTEVITDTLIRFHPRDARAWVKERFGATLARYNIPLDKIFYAG